MTAKGDSGFSIIELLIVLGMLTILVGIAVGNYAQLTTRAKRSRVLSDHKTIRVGLESYFVDQNAYPRMASSLYKDPSFDFIDGTPVSGVLSKVVSTPIAYLTTSVMPDPFMVSRRDAPLDERLYTYQVLSVYVTRNPTSEFWPRALSYYGEYRLGSVGPDLVFDHLFLNSAQLPYDPTNGIISLGNIWTAHKPSEICPEVPHLLGYH